MTTVVEPISSCWLGQFTFTSSARTSLKNTTTRSYIQQYPPVKSILVAGLVLIGSAALDWQRGAFGDLDYASTLRQVVPGVTLAALGIQTILSGFFVSMLGMSRR